jgi:hypothetical protein
MKTLKFLSALALASAALGAQAADISNPVENLTWDEDNAAFFGQLIPSGNGGNTFADQYSFTTTVAGSLWGEVLSRGGNDRNGLAINDFSLFSADGTELLTATQNASGQLDDWSFTYDNLAAGTYYVQISGSVLGNGAARYNANLALAPVPEPETYAMMLGGLGLLAVAARRRKQKEQA